MEVIILYIIFTIGLFFICGRLIGWALGISKIVDQIAHSCSLLQQAQNEKSEQLNKLLAQINKNQITTNELINALLERR